MSLKTLLLAASTATAFALPALAGPEISIADPYAIAAGPMAPAGAAYFTIRNTGDEADRLLSVASDVASLTQLHTHIISDDGIARMEQVKDGLPVPAHGDHPLARGGDHVMFMGLKAPFIDGEVIRLTLDFEKSGPMQIDVPVDLARASEGMPGMQMDHDSMTMDDMDHGDMGDMDMDGDSN